MSLGSFLASAGRIGAGIETSRARSEQLRLQTLQSQLARDELERAEVARAKAQVPLTQLTTAQLEAPSFRLGAPMEVLDAVPAPTPTPVSTEITDADAKAIAQRAFETGAGILTPKTGAAAPMTKPVRFAGVTVPGTLGGTDRLGTGVGGFKKIDPNTSDNQREFLEGSNARRLGISLRELARSAGYFDLGGWRMANATQDEKKKMERGNRASAWYESDKANQYFRQNPELLDVAKRDPVGFYEAVVQAGKKGKAAPAPREGAGVTIEDALAGRAPTIPSGVSIEEALQMRRAPTAGAGTASADVVYGFGKYGLPDKPLSTMRIGEVMNFQRGTLIPNTRGKIGAGPDKGTGAVGTYQITYGTLREYAPRVLGDKWRQVQFTAEVQDRIARAIYEDNKDGNLKKIWAGLPNNKPGEYSNVPWEEARGRIARVESGGGGGAAPQRAGVDVGSSTAPAPVDIDPSNFYLGKPEMIGRDTEVALRNRQLFAQMADIYGRSGFVEQAMQFSMKVQEVDDRLWYLEGMRGINELAYANDPLRIAAVWSHYATVPIELQPRRDGTYDLVVNGKTTQKGVAVQSIVDNARSAFDAEYRKAQTESNMATSLELFKSRLRISEEQAKIVANSFAKMQELVTKGEIDRALKIMDQLDPNGKITPLGDGSGRAYYQVQGQTMLVDPGGQPIPDSEGLTTAPSAAPITSLPGRSVSVGVGT
jgi:hypothetical protein